MQEANLICNTLTVATMDPFWIKSSWGSRCDGTFNLSVAHWQGQFPLKCRICNPFQLFYWSWHLLYTMHSFRSSEMGNDSPQWEASLLQKHCKRHVAPHIYIVWGRPNFFLIRENKKKCFLSLPIEYSNLNWAVLFALSRRTAEVMRRNEGPSPKSLDLDENFKP